MLKKLPLLFLLVLLSPSLFFAKTVETRVLLGFNKKYQITPKGTYHIIINKKKSSYQGKLEIKFDKQGLLINNKLFKTSRIDIRDTLAFSVNGIIYRGTFTIHREKNTLSLINNVELERYLLSVVPSEVYKSWNMEALKAQAVAARSYALYEIKRSRINKNKKFDVYTDTRSQVYRGAKTEHPKTTRAVLSTKGQILTYQGQIVKAYFSSSIGGISASGYEIGDNKPYLKPIKSYHSKQNPNKIWGLQIPLTKIQKRYKTTKITDITVSSRTSSGRIAYVKIKDSRGKITTIRGDHFRANLGYNNMKSTLAKITVSKSNNLIIKGRGYGHGVGMGQWEAQELARRGAHYTQILKRFYQGTKLQKIY